jgi:hypothetical protein
VLVVVVISGNEITTTSSPAGAAVFVHTDSLPVLTRFSHRAYGMERKALQAQGLIPIRMPEDVQKRSPS